MGNKETPAISVEELQKQQTVLKIACLKAQEAMYVAKTVYADKKTVFAKFNNKYGRVLQMMKED